MTTPRYRGIMRRIRSKIGRALDDYAMTADGDRLLVAVSGGKDSLALLHMLATRRAWIPIDYTLVPAFVSLGEAEDREREAPVRRLTAELGLPLEVIETDIGRRLQAGGLPESNCFHCSRWKRRALFERARELKIAKVAFGHHQDDFIETALLNLFYGSNFSTMHPHQRLFAGRLALIRPLVYISAAEVICYCRRHSLPLDQPPCGFQAADARRLRVRRLLAELTRENPRVRGSIFHALGNVRPDYLLDAGRGDG
ncbi:MAG: tRNA 2-thiocytidine biosynthesis protein TtcA [Deltaproteobacteria bacterium]|nr:tRNA 2-thiocytidine biosynthesis protein TtcA [Candidatus Anaeroferrophillacea bacterium]